MDPTAWPELPYAAWQDTYQTLHRWTQMVGKIRVVREPWVNHSWHVVLYVDAHGLTTSVLPYGDRSFQLGFDFVEHVLKIETSDRPTRTIALEPRSVASFYTAVSSELAALDLPVAIHDRPNELADAIPFSQDTRHASYDREYVERFFRILRSSDRVLKQFRTGFLGKCSPVHFFWGSFDLAVTRFSGRRAPPHPGGVPHLPLAVVREAYSHEVSSAGFWPGGGPLPMPVYYAYAYPEPKGFREAKLKPQAAYYHEGLGEHVLPYDAVRTSDNPDQALLAFLQSSYQAAADAARWNRAELECSMGVPCVPRAT